MAERLVLRENLGYKKDALLGYSPTSVGTFIPVPISFSRASSASGAGDGFATRGYSVPRIKSDGALLLEPSRTNLLLRSEEFDNAAWTKVSTTISSDAEVAPDDGVTADLISGDGATSSHRIFQTFTPSAGADYVASVFAKAGSNNFIQIAVSGGSSFGVTNYTNFDLLNGTAGTTGGGQVGSIKNYGNGWYRCEVVINNGGTASYSQVDFAIVESASSPRLQSWSTTNGVYIWGAQIEAGSYPTSYIPTTTTTVTRAAETLSKTGIADLLGDSEGTIYFEGSYFEGGDSHFSISDGSNTNRVQLQFDGDQVTYIVQSGTIQVNASASSTSANTTYKLAARYKVNDFKVYLNGVEIISDTLGNTFTDGSLTNLRFGDPDGNPAFYGNVKSLAVWNTALTDEELEALTS